MRGFFDIFVVCLVSTMLLAACSDPVEPEPEPGASERQQRQEQGRFQEDRVWPGLAEGKCGARLTVATPDGQREEYWPPQDFFDAFDSQKIKEREVFRPAANMAQVMEQLGAEIVRVLSCRGDDLSLDQPQLAARTGWLVLTGRGTLKLVGQEGDEYLTVVRQIKEIQFTSAAPAGEDSE